VKVNATTPLPRAKVRAERSALTSRAGSALVSALADRLGLTEGLTAALCCHSRKVRHEPGRVARDLSVMLGGGDDCLSDLGAFRDQVVLFGEMPRRLILDIDATLLTAHSEVRDRRWTGLSGGLWPGSYQVTPTNLAAGGGGHGRTLVSPLGRQQPKGSPRRHAAGYPTKSGIPTDRDRH